MARYIVMKIGTLKRSFASSVIIGRTNTRRKARLIRSAFLKKHPKSRIWITSVKEGI